MDQQLIQNQIPDDSIHIHFPNNTTAQSIATGTYQPNERVEPVPATMFKDEDLRQSIIGLSPICQNGQQILLTETTLDIIKDGTVLLRTYKKPMDKLWNFPRRKTISQK